MTIYGGHLSKALCLFSAPPLGKHSNPGGGLNSFTFISQGDLGVLGLRSYPWVPPPTAQPQHPQFIVGICGDCAVVAGGAGLPGGGAGGPGCVTGLAVGPRFARL